MKGEILEAGFASFESQQVLYEHSHKMEVSSKSNDDATSQSIMNLMKTTISSTRSEHVYDFFSNPLSDSPEMPHISTSNDHVKITCELKAEESYFERPQSSSSDCSHTIDPINVEVINQTTNLGNRIGYQLNSSKTDVTRFGSHKQSSSKYRLIDINSKFEPSDIVKSILAKPSVFDEDTKRLKHLSGKYVPKQFLPRISFCTERTSPSQFMPSSSVSWLPPSTIITNDQSNNIIKTNPPDLKSLPHNSKSLTKTKLAPVDLSRSLTGMRELFSTRQNINDSSDSTIDSNYFSPNNSVSSGEDDAQTLHNGNICQIYTKNWLDSLERSNEKACQLREIPDYWRLSGEEKLNEKQISKQSSSVQFSGERKRPSETIVHSSSSSIGIQEKKTNDSYFKMHSEQKNIVNIKSVHKSVSTISDEKKTCYLPFKKRACIKQNFIDPDYVEIQEKSGPELREKESKECKTIKNQLFDFNLLETNFNKTVSPSNNSKSMNIEKKIDLLKMNQKPKTIKEDKVRVIYKTYKKDNISKLKEKSLDELGTDISTLNKRTTRSSSRLNDLNKSNIDNKNSKGNNKKNCSFSKMSDSKNKINSLEKNSKNNKVNQKLLNEEVGNPSTSTSASEIVLFQPYVSMYDKVKTRSCRRIRNQEK